MEGGARVLHCVVLYVLNLSEHNRDGTSSSDTTMKCFFQLAANQKPKNTAAIIKGDSGARLHTENTSVWWKASAHNLKDTYSFFQRSSLHISLYGRLFQALGPTP